MNLHNTRIIVTGGAGFIGSHVVDELATRGNHVVVVDNLSTGSKENLDVHLLQRVCHESQQTGRNGLVGSAPAVSGPNPPDGRVDLIQADITDADAMADLITDAEVVIHMAVACVRTSLNEPEVVHQANTTGSLNVALAAQRNSIKRLVYVSSSEAYGTAQTVPMAESHPTEPTTVYGASKLAGEAYARAMGHTYGMEVTVIRPFNSYGPREPHSGKRAEVIPKFVLRTMAGARPIIFGSGLQTRDFTWVLDTAQGICAAAAEDMLVGRTVNLARGQEVSIRHLADKVLSIFGRGGEPPVYDAPRPGDVDRHYADTAQASVKLKWAPTVSIDEGLRRYIDWLDTQDIDLEQWLATDEQRNW